MPTDGPLPQGFALFDNFLSEDEEAHLLTILPSLTFGSVQMHGVVAKRRVAQFGWHYSFESFRLTPAPPLPQEFEPLRRRTAESAGVSVEQWSEALVTEYPAGAGIGWHRDGPPFGLVAGISLGADC